MLKDGARFVSIFSAWTLSIFIVIVLKVRIESNWKLESSKLMLKPQVAPCTQAFSLLHKERYNVLPAVPMNKKYALKRD